MKHLFNRSANYFFNATASLDYADLEYCVPFTNTSEDDVDDSEENYFILLNFVTYTILLNSIGIFGIFGNIISMILLSRPQMKSSINYLLINLVRCDTVLIIIYFLLFGMTSIYVTTGYLFTYFFRVYPVIVPICFPIAMISQTASVYLTLVVTLERFVAVCHPLQARSFCTYGRARLYVTLVIIFSVLYNITRFWELYAKECKHDIYDEPVYITLYTSLRYNGYYIKIYVNWMYSIFMYFIPFGFLAVLNTAIYRQVRKANQERQHLSQLQKKEVGLATMLLCVVIVFLLCNFLPLITNVQEALYGGGQENDFLVLTGNLTITINSSVNFVIYVTFGEKFKKLFFKLFFPHGLRFCGNASGGRDSPEQIHVDRY